MPVDMSRYPADWPRISYRIRFVRGGGRCECTGECGTHAGRCDARHEQAHPVTGTKVILTTAHLGTKKPDGTPGNKHDKMDVRDENLKGMCQRCHLIFDLEDHMQNAKTTRNTKKLKAMIDAGQLQMGL